MKTGFNMAPLSGVAVPFWAPYMSEAEFCTRYVWEAVFTADMHGCKTFVTSDGSSKSRATRQNSRHLNLMLLCGATDRGCGSIYISNKSSKLNRRRALKAAAMLAHLCGKEIALIEAETGSVEDLTIRKYMAFCWLVRMPFTQDCKNAGQQLAGAVRYSYGLQSSDNEGVGGSGSNTTNDRSTAGASYSW